MAVRKKLWKTMRMLDPRPLERRHRHGCPAGGGHAVDRFPRAQRKENHAVRVPGSSQPRKGFAQHQGGATGGVDLVQLSIGEEAQEPAVGRPEGMRRRLGPRERPGGEGVERPHPELFRALFVRRDEGHPGTVWGEGHCTLPRLEAHASRKPERSTHDPWRLLARVPPGPPRARSQDRQHDRPDRPREPLPCLPPASHRGRRPGLGSRLLDPPQRRGQVVSRMPAVVGVLGQAGLHDVIETGRGERLERRDRRRFPLENGGNQTRPALSVESPSPRQHLVEHGPEGEEVGPAVRVFALELLRRHIRVSPQDRPDLGEGSMLGGYGRRRCGGVRRVSPPQLGQPEVQELRPRLRQHDVARLQVPVHDALPMGRVQRLGDLDGALERLLQRQRPLLQPLGEGLALQVLHHQVVDTVFLAHVVERADVGVGQTGNGLGLPLEALPENGVGGKLGGEDLQGDGAVQAGVLRPVDFAHPPAPMGPRISNAPSRRPDSRGIVGCRSPHPRVE